MKVAIIGTGYVGIAQGVCLAELGNYVVGVDIDKEKIEKLKQGISPIYEPGISELIKKNLTAGRLNFSTSLKNSIQDAEVIFIAVGTPPNEDGSADLHYVFEAAEEIGKNLKKFTVIVNKSTVPVGTGELVKNIIRQHYKGKFTVVSNPEFFREGSAVEDFTHSDRIIIGENDSKKGTELLIKLYEVLGAPILTTNLETAEMIKYASNSFLATQISFINSISRICNKVGADVVEVAKGMRYDQRIGHKAFLNAGLGYGGSCLRKDVKAMIDIAKKQGVDFRILEEVENINYSQRQEQADLISNVLKDLKNKKIAVWGVAFKPRTDDVRESPALDVITELMKKEAKITAYDPVAAANVRKLNLDINFASDPVKACQGADALFIATEWDEFKQLDLTKVKKALRQPIIFDGRNIYSPTAMNKLGFTYYGIGRNYSN